MKIGVIGLGYVGLPRCLQFLKKGFDVYGFDTDISKIKILKNGKSYLTNVNKNEIKNYINKKLFVYNSFENIEKLDFIVICFGARSKSTGDPTPTNHYHLPPPALTLSAHGGSARLPCSAYTG